MNENGHLNPKDRKAMLDAARLTGEAERALKRVDMRRYRQNPLAKAIIVDLRATTEGTTEKIKRVASL